ncbi:PEP/pyruvate-binding domain-containing protein [Desulfocurvibacter africanus]|uniref:Pyruvate phosphate dikinase PEP/pyruvate-binding protein n=1 Tax=Desulfocurvibacter africanus subsp. africanus str. Walvis Bay TaxID=690850 RepID=F3YUF0_DESAF|nr:PEP/pyruvate-binding domain-containing protein [Desulfocurvibacter africanus]EGJ48832.1 pyruvate phosphate dikinase PEP/pyruvate-binding protein [Desulfocurvibacter africanus subsp. africanus str. Walvis Bay]
MIGDEQARGSRASFLTAVVLALLFISALNRGAAWGENPPELDQEQARGWVADMKDSQRGPFKRLRWFCADGEILPPDPHGCADHGGGRQHGEWSEETQALRQAGYELATVLASLNIQEFLSRADYASALKQMILEHYLVAADDGWIYRRARFYRGALQAQDEDASGRALLLALLDRREWCADSFLVLREAVRSLPHGRWQGPLTEARSLAASIEARDEGFADLRAKLHGTPGPEDAQLVRDYALHLGQLELLVDYERLVVMLQDVYRPIKLREGLESLAAKAADPGLAASLRAEATLLDGDGGDGGAAERFAAVARAMAASRRDFEAFATAEDRLAALDLSLDLEAEAYGLTAELLRIRATANRAEQLVWLGQASQALYGMGLLGSRELDALRVSLAGLDAEWVALTTYREALGYQERASDWAARSLHYYFSQDVERFAQIEPLAERYAQERLRASPLALHAAVCEALLSDADRTLGLSHWLAGQAVSSGLRGLNPGLARGVLRVHPAGKPLSALESEGIHVLAATTSDLPPVAGILTLGMGNSLSHVQLLARNLGIPNAAVDQALLPSLAALNGQRVVLAVSPGGRVRLERDGPRWDALFAPQEQAPKDFLIPADTGKLELGVTELVPLGHLVADDAGRVAGPKACNLGELKAAFPEAVSEGLVIPFGAYAQILERPVRPGGPSMREFLRQGYALARGMRDGQARQKAEAELLAEARSWFESLELGPEFTERLRAAMEQRFGPDRSYGVFVRSDTNVEDLPGFTGAGLNKTVPNVVGFDKVLDAIRKVWASPFSERAYGWRQAHMQDPSGLFVSVLIQQTVPVDKSGVLVTTDIHGGRQGRISVAVNEGLGGAVDGQLAEELCLEPATGQSVFLAPAAEPFKRVALPTGDLDKLPCAGGMVLTQAEEQILCELAESAPRRFRDLRGQNGEALPADMEFGFLNGRLALFQIRPFVTSETARRNAFLLSMDKELVALDSARVNMRGTP